MATIPIAIAALAGIAAHPAAAAPHSGGDRCSASKIVISRGAVPRHRHGRLGVALRISGSPGVRVAVKAGGRARLLGRKRGLRLRPVRTRARPKPHRVWLRLLGRVSRRAEPGSRARVTVRVRPLRRPGCRRPQPTVRTFNLRLGRR